MKRLKIPVNDYTTPSPFSVQRTTPITKVLDIMREHGVRHVPVVEDRIAVGIISERDLKLLEHLESAERIKAEDVMVPEPYTVAYTAPLEDVVLAMARQKIGSAIVNLKDGHILGIFTSTDAMNALVEIVRGEARP